jgi:hypothetical protein
VVADPNGSEKPPQGAEGPMGDLGWSDALTLVLILMLGAWVLAILFVGHTVRRSRRLAARNMWAACGGCGPDGQRLKPRACPNCQGPMRPAYFLLGGGVWFYDSREDGERVITPRTEENAEELARAVERIVPTVLLGEGGYRAGYGRWPKDGLYCAWCGTFAVVDPADARRAAATDGELEAGPPPAHPPPIGPDDYRSNGFACCICRGLTSESGDQVHPLDPCSLQVTSNMNKHDRYRKVMGLFCHFECLRRVLPDPLLAEYFLRPGCTTEGAPGNGCGPGGCPG